jgi:hypothetical protein
MAVLGYAATEKVCMAAAEKFCTSDQEIFLSYAAYGLTYGGIVGLALGNMPAGSDISVFTTPMVKTLFKTGYIGERVFSLMHKGTDNWVDWGTPTNYGTSSIISVKSDGFFWTTTPTGVKFGDSWPAFFLSWKLPAVFSNTTQLSYVPSGEALGFFTHLLAGNTYVRESGLFYVSCDLTLWKSVFFLVGGYWLEV